MGSPSITRDSLEGTELPEISRSLREGDDDPEPEDEFESKQALPVELASLSPGPVHDLSATQREEELETKKQEARALVEERRVMLEKQELLKRQTEETHKRQQRRDRHNKKKRVESVDKSNKGPGSESEEETKPTTSDSDHSFEESTEEENPFELCYSPDKSKVTSPFRDASGYHKPDLGGYQSQDKEDRKILIEDSYKGSGNWEPGQGGITSCWSGVVSQLCGSSTHLWLNLPLVSMFAYDPVPDGES
jgi:hypothetical protein